MINEIFVVEDTDEIIRSLKPKFKSNKDIVLRHMPSCNLENHLLDIPSLILINEDGLEKNNILDICDLIRNNEDNSATPLMVISSDSSLEHEKCVLKKKVEYYIQKPFDNEVMYYQLKNFLELLAINRGISPLTKLPR